jgi:hypothetical protein
MKIIDVYNKMKYSTRGDNPLVTISNKDTTEIFNAKLSYSNRACHYVEYKFISPEWNDEMDFEPRKICTNEIRFSRKSNALRFIKLVNAEGEYIDTEKPKSREYMIKFEKDALYSMVNDPSWRYSMWEANEREGIMPSKSLLTKAYWITQKSIMEYLTRVIECGLYADEVEELINDKEELRKVAKEIITYL